MSRRLLRLAERTAVVQVQEAHWKDGAQNADAAGDILCRMGKDTHLHPPPLVTATTPISYLLMANGLRMSLRGEKVLQASNDREMQYKKGFHLINIQSIYNLKLSLTHGIGIGNEEYCNTHTYGSGRIIIMAHQSNSTNMLIRDLITEFSFVEHLLRLFSLSPEALYRESLGKQRKYFSMC